MQTRSRKITMGFSLILKGSGQDVDIDRVGRRARRGR